MTATRTKRPVDTGDVGMKRAEEVEQNQVARFGQLRLPYNDVFKERFDVDRATYKVLIEAIWPSAKTVDAIALALSYCKARKLDPMKRVVHIVPMWNSTLWREVETVWPGIAELRTTAARTGEYAGIDGVELGPMVEITFTGKTRGREPKELTEAVTVPEWARCTVYRVVKGVRCPFVGPKVYWKETFADVAGSGVPNSMWAERPVGQIEKCAEAAALRRAFPEELGSTYAAEEMDGRSMTAAAALGAEVAAVDPQKTEEKASTAAATTSTEVDPEPPTPTRPASASEPATEQSPPPAATAEPAATAAPAEVKKRKALTADHSGILRDAMFKRIDQAADKAALAKWYAQAVAELETLLDTDKQEVVERMQDKMIAFDEQPVE